MAKTFDDLSEAELGRLTRSRYDRLCEAHDMGLDDGPHPSERWAADTEILKAHREALKANDAGGLGNVNIQRDPSGKPLKGTDTQQPEITGGVSTSKPAVDAALDAARRVNPTRVANMAAAIPGYNRLNRR